MAVALTCTIVTAEIVGVVSAAIGTMNPVSKKKKKKKKSL